MFPLTTFTPAAAQQNLQSDGINSLGLATVLLSPRWADGTPLSGDYSAADLTLRLGVIHAPFRGIREFTFSPAASTLAAGLSAAATTINLAGGSGNNFPAPTSGSMLLVISNPAGSKREIVACTARAGDALTVARGAEGTAAQSFGAGDKVTLRLASGTRTSDFLGANGNPLQGAATVLRLHPQAILRLERLAAARYALPGEAQVRPVPWAVVVRASAGFSTARWFQPDETMTGISGLVSFHDGRGQIIDPVYVAALFADLQASLPGLIGANPSGPANGAGGVQQIANLQSGTLVHVVDPHGGLYQPALPAATLVTKNGGGTVTGSVPANGLITLNAGDGIDAASGDNGRLRWGWATNGVLARTRLVPPALPATGMPAPALNRQFFRVCAIDSTWHLLGNRSSAALLGVGPDDQKIPADLLPLVRDQVIIQYLADGPDVLGESAAVLGRPNQGMVLAVSPAIDGAMIVPAQRGANAHWPAFPAPDSGAGFPPSPPSPSAGITAAFATGDDVVVTLVADAAPDGAHVRIFPQRFVEIAAIAAEPSFIRGNGGATIAAAGVPSAVLLRNPFGLIPGASRPSPAQLAMDIVIAPRSGRRRITGAVSVNVAAGPAAPPPDPFAGANLLGALPDMIKSIAPSPLFGIPTLTAPPAGGAPSSPIALVRALASESSPRIGPRLPTMGRLETIVATGATGGAPADTLLWDAVLSGGRWARETRSARHESGNPGNPAGPDVHAAGIRVTGALAYDLARHAMRRIQPLLPLPGAPTPGWIVAMGGNNFNQPQDSSAANTGMGVLLETVAAICETPELSPATPPAAGLTVQQMVNNAATALGISPAPTITIANEARLQKEVRREFFVSKDGLRDAMWSLRRAVRQARELIYIESPQFSRTSHGAGGVDLVAELAAAMQAHGNLKAVVCTPREADFAPKFRPWARQHYRARNEAVGDLLTVDPERVAVFHPPGFPGRPAFIRTTSVFVDDVWYLTGAAHWRRRGMTFDGSASIASFDRQWENGYSQSVRAARRALMAAKLGIAAPAAGAAPTAEWLRLGRPGSAFDLIADLLAQGGLGRIQPLWPGPSDTTILPATDDMADPDGTNGASFVGFFASLLAEAGDDSSLPLDPNS